jgi:CheY-specific phosphatase CheX
VQLALEHVLAFLDDASSVLRSMIGNEQRPVVTEEQGRVISVVVHARGDLAGFTWSFPAEIAGRVAESMVPGVQPDGELREAAASELANVLTGRGLQTLADRGVMCEIEPPQISQGDPQGATYVVDTQVGIVSVTFHHLGTPPAFSGRSFLIGADAQIMRTWNDGAVEAATPTLSAALGVESAALAGVRAVLIAAIGTPATQWAAIEKQLPMLLKRSDGSAIVVHWQPVAASGQLIGIAMFVLPIRR